MTTTPPTNLGNDEVAKLFVNGGDSIEQSSRDLRNAIGYLTAAQVASVTSSIQGDVAKVQVVTLAFPSTGCADGYFASAKSQWISAAKRLKGHSISLSEPGGAYLATFQPELKASKSHEIFEKNAYVVLLVGDDDDITKSTAASVATNIPS